MGLPTVVNIFYQILTLAKRESYGVEGGTLVFMFIPPSTSPAYPTLIKIGRFPLDPTKASTYVLHLTLQQNCAIKVKLTNLIRMVLGKEAELEVSENYVLKKRQLHR